MSLEHSPARQNKKSAATHDTTPPITHDTAPPSPGQRLLKKAQVCNRVGVSFPTLWNWMLAGKFPRARNAANGMPVWLESEVSAWMQNLPVKAYKGDPDAAQINAARIRASEASVESRRRAKAAERKKNVRARKARRGRPV